MNTINKIDENTKVYAWWKTVCSDDNCYKLSDVKNKKITFGEVLEAMKKNDGGDDVFYPLVGIGWSEVRCEIFVKMCDIFGLSYTTIYNLWIGGMSGVKKECEKYMKLAKYRGNDMKRFADKIGKVARISVDESESVDYWKEYFANLVDDYNRLCA